MKVKEVLIKAAARLGFADVAKWLGGEEAEMIESAEGATWSEEEVVEAREKAEALLDFYNEVEKELAVDYFPLYREKICDTDTGKIRYDSFDRDICQIRSIKDEYGKKLDYRIYAEYLETDKGKVNIVYAYRPNDKTMDEECEVYFGVSVATIVAGIVKSYYLSCGALNESAVWNKVYYEDVRSIANAAEKRKRMPGRSWV